MEAETPSPSVPAAPAAGQPAGRLALMGRLGRDIRGGEMMAEHLRREAGEAEAVLRARRSALKACQRRLAELTEDLVLVARGEPPRQRQQDLPFEPGAAGGSPPRPPAAGRPASVDGYIRAIWDDELREWAARAWDWLAGPPALEPGRAGRSGCKQRRTPGGRHE